MQTEVSAISFIGASLLDEGWYSCSPPEPRFKAVAAFFSTGHFLDTLVAHRVGVISPALSRILDGFFCRDPFCPISFQGQR
jgi:hypothetical protein